MKVIKRDGSEVPFDYRKIQNVIESANAEVAEADRLSDTEDGFIVGRIEKRCDGLGRSVSVEEIQDMVIDELDQSEHYRLARHYSDYRLRHELLRKQNSTDAKILSLLRHDNELAKQENANKDPIGSFRVVILRSKFMPKDPLKLVQVITGDWLKVMYFLDYRTITAYCVA